MKIYTKTGDDGSTGLMGGQRVRKTDPRVAAYGEVDELNAALGMALAAGAPGASQGRGPGELATLLENLQRDLFVLGADLATPTGKETAYLPRILPDHVAALERLIDEHDARLPALRNFILPGGSPLAAHLHHARTVCRRAERATVALAAKEDIGPLPVRFLNRLADLLFVLARRANHVAGVAETEWAPRRIE
jgi:cob(I)alamin adenosyltransferase